MNSFKGSNLDPLNLPLDIDLDQLNNYVEANLSGNEGAIFDFNISITS